MAAGERWLTFDCFGTLVSWQRGFPQILRRVAGERALELADAYHRFERRFETGAYLPYKTVLRESLREAARTIGFPLRAQDEDVLSEHWDEQPVFEDVAPTLQAVQSAGWRVAALTNCDGDLFERTIRALPFVLDDAVTAEEVRSYKPAHAHFLKFAQLHPAPAAWLHVACSYFHDIRPAHELGIRSIWIDRDRTGEDPSIAAAVQSDLRGLAEAVSRVIAQA